MMIMMKRRGKTSVLNGIRTHGLSVQAIKAYASDRAVDNDVKSYGQSCKLATSSHGT
jgi:hypothetical protein